MYLARVPVLHKVLNHNIYDERNVIYLEYVQSRWGLRTPSRLRTGYPALHYWRGEVRLVQAQDQQVTTRSPRIVTECSLTHTMLIKIVYTSYIHVFTVLNTQKVSLMHASVFYWSQTAVTSVESLTFLLSFL